jgi:hypothetical protein
MTRYVVTLTRTLTPAQALDVALRLPGLVEPHPMVRMATVDTDDPDSLDGLPDVAAVEPDEAGTVATIQEQDVTAHPSGYTLWWLDRINKTTADAMDSTYRWEHAADGVRVYLVDNGARGTHQEYAARTLPGYSASGGDPYAPAQQHGTGMASLAAGTTLGVAREADVVSVQVNDSNTLSVANFVAACDWIVGNHPGGPGVANMSLVFTTSTSVDNAAQSVVDAGLVVVAASGNNSGSAGSYSPARVADLVTVAATNQDGTFRSNSNSGTAVDLLGPGESSIVADSAADDGWTGPWNNTSVACAVVSGVAAAVWGQDPTLTNSEVRALLLTEAISGEIASVPAGTTDLFVYQPVTVAVEEPAPPEPAEGCLPAYVWTGTAYAPFGCPGDASTEPVAAELLVQDGTTPPIFLTLEDETDYLYEDV